MVNQTRSLPRWSLAFLSGLIAAILGWAAMMLPWHAWTTFAVTTAAVAIAHGLTAVAAAARHRLLARLWRAQAVVALAYLGYLTYNLVASASYIAELYGSLGRGVAVALGLVWVIVVGLTVPLSAWGIAVTGGLRISRRTTVAGAVGVLLFCGGVFRSTGAAAATPALPAEDANAEAIAAAVRDAMVAQDQLVAFDGRTPLSLWTTTPAACDTPPGPEVTTVLVTYHVADRDRPDAIANVCVQGSSLSAAAADVHRLLAHDALAAPIKIDVVTATHALESIAPVVDTMSLRPGLDGVCEEGRCFPPWQLLGSNLLVANVPIPVVPELRFGFDPIALRRALAPPDTRGPIPTGVSGFTRIETASFVTDRDGRMHRLRRLREDGPALEQETLDAALHGAERYIMRSQAEDGRFLYKIDPFSGLRSYRGFSLARQAGTTLVVCELARDRERAKQVATDALAMLASVERRTGDIGMLRRRRGDVVDLGPTALSTIAFISCRDLVGDRFDRVIDRLTRFLLSMQRDNGSFHPKFDLRAGAPVPGPDPLYAVGQAVFALTLLEKVTIDDGEAFADHDTVRAATQRAMDYIANDYWQTFARDFFFMEENWHCLAARASLGHHRHEGYEDFCLEYVHYKTRLILGEDAEVDPDLLGGYGFGNVLAPHTTGSSGFGEAGSAALAILEVRGETDGPLGREIQATMRRALTFLLHHQWREASTFASSTDFPMTGGFSEHIGSPEIRIDYVQHAMAGLGHGGRMLGLVDGQSY